MTHAWSLSMPMSRNGSGTGWQPDLSPVYAYMHHSRSGWNLMLHGSVFLSVRSVNINHRQQRGGSGIAVPNWVMGMAQRRVGSRGLLTAGTMVSLDRMTMGGDGYPLLFQSGESWQGAPLVDRQHPHDFVSGLFAGYTYQVSQHVDLNGYLGYPGEPALGPAAFMHRPSALSNPDAPLGHHWLDATHISFGVATLGIRYKWLKLEGSLFNGTEPDEDRYHFDAPRLNSYSWRISANLSEAWSAQVSAGYFNPSEEKAGEAAGTRTTASVSHSNSGPGTTINSTLAWGYNRQDHHSEHAVLLESQLGMKKNNFYGRYEWVQKSAAELQLDLPDNHGHLYNVHALTLGFSRNLLRFRNTDLAAGLQATAHRFPADLEPYYGKAPLSAQFYIRINPSRLML
ncbi:MAG: hypothetical protein MUF29_01715 [Chitinophagaceae bacterium]|jgi:hypothetical protein|nr:hypothetical protein [Chitinophagaceae bacterium]